MTKVLEQRNKEFKDVEEMWQHIPVVLVESINGHVTNVYPYENPTGEDLGKFIIDQGLKGTGGIVCSGTPRLFDLYVHGHYYDLETPPGAQTMEMLAVALNERISYCQELHRAFFPDEVDNGG